MRDAFDSLRPAIAEQLTRRDALSRVAGGLATSALGSMLMADRASAAEGPADSGSSSRTHFAPRAKAVIQLFQHGGPSHMDMLDPKPELTKRNGQPMPKYFTDLVKISAHGNLLASPFKFQPAGQCGVEYSELLPYTSQCADDIAVIRSM